jgi:2-oxo-4-hydroxy-4-carboxy-5-ureidoimidazoline decarboxylase
MANLAELNAVDEAAFVRVLGGLYEQSPWVAAETYARRPFPDAGQLYADLAATVAQSGPERQLALIRAHPDLAGRLAQAGQLTPESTREQAAAGLNQLAAAELADFQRLNAAYRERFGFPFVICARLNDRAAIFQAMQRRLAHSAAEERAAALAEIDKIAWLRLQDALKV